MQGAWEGSRPALAPGVTTVLKRVWRGGELHGRELGPPCKARGHLGLNGSVTFS